MKKGVVVFCRRGLTGLSPNLLLSILNFNDFGISLQLKEELKIGEIVEIELVGVGRSKPLRVPGDVRWAKTEDEERYIVGIHFRQKIPYSEIANFC